MMERQVDKLFILGDTHGYFGQLNAYMNELAQKFPKKRIALIQCGDFCFWEAAAPIAQLKVPDNIELFACPGNHEDWDYLDTLGYNVTEVAPRVWYMPFGSTLLLNELTFLFCGKADSIDKRARVQGVSWWPQELISYRDMAQLDESLKVDVVISHTAPTYFDLGNHYKNDGYYKDPCRDALSTVWDMYKPSKWFFGHYHMFAQRSYRGTRWTVLGDIGNPHEKAWVDAMVELQYGIKAKNEIVP